MKITALLLAGATFTISASVLADDTYKAHLSGGEQVRTAQIPDINGDPVTIPIGPLTTGAHGSAHFTMTDAGLAYTIKASGFSTALFMAHIHLGPKGGNGPIMVWLYGDKKLAPFSPREDDGPFDGSFSDVLTAADLDLLSPESREGLAALGIETADDVMTNIRNGNAYVNLHTLANPPGEIRGQIGAVPHPMTQ